MNGNEMRMWSSGCSQLRVDAEMDVTCGAVGAASSGVKSSEKQLQIQGGCRNGWHMWSSGCRQLRCEERGIAADPGRCWYFFGGGEMGSLFRALITYSNQAIISTLLVVHNFVVLLSNYKYYFEILVINKLCISFHYRMACSTSPVIHFLSMSRVDTILVIT
ncbi:uncharacterized protein LOC129707496 isoform X13 [Leucoraja erinacea]|uniref:uncharacterized protein LOC129707496 isoform X13 n=1 Tax=Leucoraja erinaceus TaxID=7782 RepID=UPI0024545136|nr:uncharacterized protein LOC129707496 isoform X13 [Leucoraja erinacea]